MNILILDLFQKCKASHLLSMYWSFPPCCFNEMTWCFWFVVWAEDNIGSAAACSIWQTQSEPSLDNWISMGNWQTETHLHPSMCHVSCISRPSVCCISLLVCPLHLSACVSCVSGESSVCSNPSVSYWGLRSPSPSLPSHEWTFWKLK